MGGEHPSSIHNVVGNFGSSPRGRGTRWKCSREAPPPRFIPAWAGNTAYALRIANTSPVHPRVGGEHPSSIHNVVGNFGSSPRGRGTRWKCSREAPPPRFIPAWAGNTAYALRIANTSPVHPRVGGEHLKLTVLVSDINGSSPRGRGTQRKCDEICANIRFIPAWAGNTSTTSLPWLVGSVHPRVGGEHISKLTVLVLINGSSPRGRGTQSARRWEHQEQRFIPAWAGNTTPHTVCSITGSVHPRVGGEHLLNWMTSSVLNGSSPRGRGTLAQSGRPRASDRFIPAWAGNTRN